MKNITLFTCLILLCNFTPVYGQQEVSPINQTTSSFNLCAEGINFQNDRRALDNSFNISPNPADNYIILKNRCIKDRVASKLKIFDILGKTVMSVDINFVSGESELNVASLVAGTYVLNLQLANTSVYRKLIIR